MKRETLKEYGLEKEAIDKILDENMADIGEAKKSVSDEMQKEIDRLKMEVETRDNQLEGLKGIDAEALKDEIKTLQDANKKAKDDYEKEINSIKLSSAIKEDLHNAGAKEIETLMKLINKDSITLNNEGKTVGLSEQIETLKNGEITKAFFGDNSSPFGKTPPNSGKPATKKPSEMTYTELAKFMEENPGVDIHSLG